MAIFVNGNGLASDRRRGPFLDRQARPRRHQRLNRIGEVFSVDVMVAAFDAQVHLETPAGPRVVPLDEFYVGPDGDATRETVLGHGELVTAVEIPPLPFAPRSTYRKVRDRASYAFAVASIAAAVDVADGVIRDVRIALGANRSGIVTMVLKRALLLLAIGLTLGTGGAIATERLLRGVVFTPGENGSMFLLAATGVIAGSESCPIALLGDRTKIYEAGLVVSVVSPTGVRSHPPAAADPRAASQRLRYVAV